MTNLPKLTLITGTTDLLVDRALEKVWGALKGNNKDISKQEIDATSEDAYIQFADAMSPNLFGSSYLVIVDHINVAEDKLDEKLVEALKNADANKHANNIEPPKVAATCTEVILPLIATGGYLVNDNA